MNTENKETGGAPNNGELGALDAASSLGIHQLPRGVGVLVSSQRKRALTTKTATGGKKRKG